MYERFNHMSATHPTSPEVSKATRDCAPIYNPMAPAEVGECLVPVNGTAMWGL